MQNVTKYLTFNPLYVDQHGKLEKLVSNEPEELQAFINKYSHIINCNLKIFRMQMVYPKQMSVYYIGILLRKIIPIEVFGTLHNFKKFYGLIKKLCTCSVHENISYKNIIKGWNINDILWLKSASNKKMLLVKIIIWLFKIVKMKIIRKLFFLQSSKTSYKVSYYPRNAYRSLKDKAINAMVEKKQLEPCNVNLNCRTTLNIMPKNGMKSYRPIVKTFLLKNINKKVIINVLRNKGATFNRNLYSAWNTFCKSSKNKQIYGVKIDLEDAFSNVNIDTVKELLRKILMNYNMSYNSIVHALEKQVIKTSRKKFYKWNRGLMQGMRLSAQLCDLYRAFFDLKYLKKFITERNFFHRTVDDYFFCSTNKNEVLRFKQILENKCLISSHKTLTNINNEVDKILYNGRIFDLKTKEILIHFDSSLQTYRYKSKIYYNEVFFEKDQKQLFFQVGSLTTNAFSFNKVLLNKRYNSSDTVLQNYFKAMVHVAFKTDCLVKENFKKTPAFLLDSIINLIKYYVKKVRTLLKNSLKEGECLGIPRKVLKVIAIKAFILVYQKRFLQYTNVIKSLKDYIRTYRHSLLGTKFNKLPEEFKNIRMKRI